MDRTYTEGKQDAQIDALFEAVNRIERSQERFQKDIQEEIHRAIDPVRKAVLGNGQPRQGLAATVVFHDKIIKWELGLIGSLFIGMIVSFLAK